MTTRIIFILLLQVTLKAQNDFVIKGQATLFKTNPIDHACSLKLTLDSVDTFTTDLDKNGNYQFIIPSNNKTIRHAELSLVDEDYKKTKAQFTNCLIFMNSEWYYLHSDKFKLTKTKSATDTIIHDISVSHMNACNSIPSVYFKLNSSEFADNSEFNNDTIVHCYSRIFINNPNCGIEVFGNSGIYEKLPEKIAQDRAEKIKLLLIKYGFPSDRIKITNRSNTKLRVSKDVINRGTKEEKIKLDEKNYYATVWTYMVK